jgi:hypothetical protein
MRRSDRRRHDRERGGDQVGDLVGEVERKGCGTRIRDRREEMDPSLYNDAKRGTWILRFITTRTAVGLESETQSESPRENALH